MAITKKRKIIGTTIISESEPEMVALLDQEYTVTKFVTLARIYTAIERFQGYSILDTDDDIYAAARKNALLHEVLFRMVSSGIPADPFTDILPIVKDALLSARSELKHPELIKIADTKIKSLGL